MAAITKQNTAVRRKSAAKSTGTKAPKASKPAAKSPVAKKAAPKKAATPKKAVKKSTGKSTTKPVAKAKSVTKKTAVKKTSAKSIAPRRAPAASKSAAATVVDPRRLDLLKMIEKSLDADKAEDIINVDLAGKSAIADFMVIATGRNARQLAAMAQHIAEKLHKAGIKAIGIEGLSQGDWVLVDGGDIIVHLFRPEIRNLYGLEKMWGVNPPAPDALQAVG